MAIISRPIGWLPDCLVLCRCLLRRQDCHWQLEAPPNVSWIVCKAQSVPSFVLSLQLHTVVDALNLSSRLLQSVGAGNVLSPLAGAGACWDPCFLWHFLSHDPAVARKASVSSTKFLISSHCYTDSPVICFEKLNVKESQICRGVVRKFGSA